MAPLYNTRETFSNTALYTTTPQIGTSEDDPSPSCLICTEPYTLAFMGSTHHALQMPSCSHVFGASCIEHWFDIASTCPLCCKDFFPMRPKEISLELQELPDLFAQMFTLLGEVKKRYPQGRMDVAGMENKIADLGEKVVKDTEERKQRKSERIVAVLLGQRQQDIQDLTTWRQRFRSRRIEDIPPPPPPPPPQAADFASVRQDTAACLDHDFGPDLAAHDGAGMLVPGTVGHTRLHNAQCLAERARSLGLSKAAEDIERKRATVFNIYNTTRFGQDIGTGRLGEGTELQRAGRLNGAAVQRRRCWGWWRRN